MTYFDPSFVAAAGNIKAPDYLSDFYRSFNLAQTLPWSAREQRKRQQEDLAQSMQTAKFAADMQDRARQNQIQEMLLPYKLQQAQRLASGIGITTPQPGAPTNDRFSRWNALLGGAPAPETAPAPMEDNTIPTPVQTVAPEGGYIPADPQPDLNVIPDIPSI